MDNIKRDLIRTIYVNEANFNYIRDTKHINGTLLQEIERVMEEYYQLKIKQYEIKSKQER
jgi:inorganic pyrophosphatase